MYRYNKEKPKLKPTKLFQKETYCFHQICISQAITLTLLYLKKNMP